MVSDCLIYTVNNILFSWLGFECTEDYIGDEDAIKKWNYKYPDASGWLKKYYEKHCTKNDKKKRWAKIEEERSKHLQGEDYRFSVVSINDIIANALEQGKLKEQVMIVKKDSVVIKSAKFKDRFQYLFCLDETEKAANPQEKTVERFLKNIAAYLYLRCSNPEGQKYVLLNTPGLFEPPVRSLRATIPDAESHQQYYSTVLLTRASTAYNFCGKQASPLPTAGLPRRISLSYAYSCKEPFAA